MRNWTLYVIHHAHTDIGYTQRQEKLKRYHADFIRQAIDILDRLHAGALRGCEGFKWQCENQWQIENFYRFATEHERRRFEGYVRSGEIGLSGNYLNMTELVDESVLGSRTAKAARYGERIGAKIKSGMSADVNGYAWGYPDALSESGVENLFCALHPHHGMFPLHQKHRPFYWKGPKGGAVLTWVGEHYHFGNELCLAPNANASYMIFDDVRRDMAEGKIYTTNADQTHAEELAAMRLRVTRYLDNLESEGYPYDFVPVLVSGTITDNAPPSAEVARRLNELNAMFEGRVTALMATLDDFFKAVRASAAPIPTYEGDFADWWADGVGSTPGTVKLFREAQRKHSICEKLDPSGELGDAGLSERAAEDMMLYAEHTWGYSSSISEPWDSLVVSLEKKKDAYAINANTAISENLDMILAKKGESAIMAGRPPRYRIINPHPFPYKGAVKLYVEYWEYPEGIQFDEYARLELYDEKTGEQIPCQGRRIARAFEIEAVLDMAPGEERTVHLRQNRENAHTVRNHVHAGSDGVRDIRTKYEPIETPFAIETPDFRVEFSPDKGVRSIFDRRAVKELVIEGSEGAFTGVYEATPAGGASAQIEARRRMGRNRSGIGTRRCFAKLRDIKIVESGDVCVTAKLSYEMEGTEFYAVYLKVYKTHPAIEARVCLHKKSVWDPENVYVALPFTAGGANETYIDKTGCVMRPGIDQLPGTCQSFYLLQNGIVRRGGEGDVIVSTKDAPLVAFGPREAGLVTLCDGENAALNASAAYSWVMNNFWETNFKADLGGFHEFTYTLLSGVQGTPGDEMALCKALNEGLIGVYLA